MKILCEVQECRELALRQAWITVSGLYVNGVHIEDRQLRVDLCRAHHEAANLIEVMAGA